MFGLGISEIVVILVIALIFIGPKKLPELARGLGKGLKEFQNAAKGIQESINNPSSHNSVEPENQTIEENPSKENTDKDNKQL